MFLISKEQTEALIQYLAKRPYEEVAQGIHMLSTLKPVEEKKEKKEEVKK